MSWLKSLINNLFGEKAKKQPTPQNKQPIVMHFKSGLKKEGFKVTGRRHWRKETKHAIIDVNLQKSSYDDVANDKHSYYVNIQIKYLPPCKEGGFTFGRIDRYFSNTIGPKPPHHFFDFDDREKFEYAYNLMIDLFNTISTKEKYHAYCKKIGEVGM